MWTEGESNEEEVTVNVTSPTNQEVEEQEAVVTTGVTIDEDDRGGWGNKVEFILATIGYAVGLGNVWRFPYLCQKNGGGAFLIPYTFNLVLLGIPIFFLELAIGQSLRKGSIGLWNEIHPYLGGLGYASVVVCFLVAVYYNMIIAWCFYYLFASFQDPLPYSSCPVVNNITLHECEMAGRTQYYWYNDALDVSSSLEESGGLIWHLCLVLLLAWIVVFLCTMRGVQSAGKVMRASCLLHCHVSLIFFVRGVTLDGAGAGVFHMFKPQFEKLANPQVWLEAATQIFYSLGVAFGGLIAMSSYNPVNNNCHRDAIMVSLINCGTSIFASIVIFSILGFKALHDCQSHYAGNSTLLGNSTVEEKCQDMEHWLSQSAQGPGLTFIAFTEAIVKMPASPLWAVLFFCMLLTLGLGSMFGTLEGVITPIYDLKLVPWRKEIVTGLISACCFLVGLLFCQRSGEYWLQMFDTFSGTLPLLFIGLFELVGVCYIYGFARFEDDIEYMIGFRPNLYFKITWKYISPVILVVIILASLVNMMLSPIGYSVWDFKAAEVKTLEYPAWGFAVITLLIVSSCMFVPVFFILRRFGILNYEKKSSKEDDIVPPGAMTPTLSRAPLRAMEVSMAGVDNEGNQ